MISISKSKFSFARKDDMMQIKKLVFLSSVVWLLTSVGCNVITDQTDGESSTMRVMVGDSTYQLTEVGGMSYMGEISYNGNIAGKKLSIVTYLDNWKNDTCSLSFYEPGSTSKSYVRYGEEFNTPNFGKVIRSSSSGSRETGTFYFDVISGSDTLHFRNGKYDIYLTPGK